MLSKDGVRTEAADAQGSAGGRTEMPESRNKQNYVQAQGA